MAKLSVKIEAVTKGLSAKLNSAKASFKKFGGSVKSIGIGLAGFGVAIGTAVIGLGRAAGQLVQTQIAMETFLGSAEKAKQLISDLRQFADVTPFDTNAVIQAGRVLAGAGVEAEGVVDVVRMLGDISAGTGKDLDEMARLYAKSMNKGKVQTRELLQLVNAGVPIIDKLAESMNRPKKAIFKMAELGKIKFKDLQKVFKDMTSESGIYSGLMEKQSKTLLGRWSTLQGKIQNLTTDIGGPLQSSLTSITDTFIDWTSQARTLNGPIGTLVKNLGAMADLLELTRDGGSIEKTTGLKEYGKGDLIADSIDNALGTAFGRLFGLGAGAVGKSAGLDGGMSQKESVRLDLLERQTIAAEKTADNTSNRKF